ncbi:MAG: hypothetical protein ABFS41_03785 [Myxococcota bacterium]
MNADDDIEMTPPDDTTGGFASGESSEDLDWAREAEERRRAGEPAQARRLAEAALVDEPRDSTGRAVLALACLDLGDVAAARDALETLVAPVGGPTAEPIDAGPAVDEPFGVVSDPLQDLAENELESAFSQVESESVEVWTTNRVAEAALRSVEEGQPEGVADVEEPESPFATETVASLLEEQGAADRAEAIRAKLERAGAPLLPDFDERARWVGTLEHWLDNLRRASR